MKKPILLLLLVSMLSAVEDCRFLKCEVKPVVRHKHLKEAAVTSTNWSGYVAGLSFVNPANYTVAKVEGSWIVPNITASSVDASCSIWVGIDGDGSPTVEQLGTEHDWSNGRESHYAWFEMFPAGSNEIVGFPVAVGDSISASVTFVQVNGVIPAANNLFILQIVNNTKKVYSIIPFVTTTVMQRVCAEWIVEAPYLNQILPLSDFGTVYVSNCSAQINSVSGPINDAAWQNESMNMVGVDGTQKSITSPLSADGKSFSVQWLHT